ncbi:MAG: hypothetical protein ACREB6_06895 [Rhodospirillales bacterium]
MSRLLAVYMVLACLAAAPARADPWAGSYDAATKTRFIPVELWTGADWDGAKVIKAGKADLTFGRRGEKSITGPEPFVRPGTNDRILVYRRENRGREGVKVQLFTISPNKDGIGRVYDSRYDRNCADEVKFPLGLWKQGESRIFEVRCGETVRRIELTIEDIDYVLGGAPHALRYRWVVDGGRQKGTDNTYVYSPRQGNIEVVEHVK